MATAKTNVTRSAQISLADVTLDDLVAAATKVGAPTSARVTTGSSGYNPSTVEGEENLPYTATFSWTESI